MIDFELSEEQQMIRDSVGAFAREEIRPAARPADESGAIPPRWSPRPGNSDSSAAQSPRNSAAAVTPALLLPARSSRRNSARRCWTEAPILARIRVESNSL